MNWAPLITGGGALLLAAAGFIRGETTRRAITGHRNWHARQRIGDQLAHSVRVAEQAAAPVPPPPAPRPATPPGADGYPPDLCDGKPVAQSSLATEPSAPWPGWLPQ